MVADRTVAHINDITAEQVYLEKRDPVAQSAASLGGIRTLLGVPLLNKGEMIGAFFLSRQEVRPFTDKQIALIQNFAAQGRERCAGRACRRVRIEGDQAASGGIQCACRFAGQRRLTCFQRALILA